MSATETLSGLSQLIVPRVQGLRQRVQWKVLMGIRKKGSRVTINHDNAACKNGHNRISERANPANLAHLNKLVLLQSCIRRQALKDSAAGEWYLSWWSPLAFAALCA